MWRGDFFGLISVVALLGMACLSLVLAARLLLLVRAPHDRAVPGASRLRRVALALIAAAIGVGLLLLLGRGLLQAVLGGTSEG